MYVCMCIYIYIYTYMYIFRSSGPLRATATERPAVTFAGALRGRGVALAAREPDIARACVQTRPTDRQTGVKTCAYAHSRPFSGAAPCVFLLSTRSFYLPDMAAVHHPHPKGVQKMGIQHTQMALLGPSNVTLFSDPPVWDGEFKQTHLWLSARKQAAL